MINSAKPATRNPLLYVMLGGCLLALAAALYLTFSADARSASASDSSDPVAAADSARASLVAASDQAKAKAKSAAGKKLPTIRGWR